MSRKEVTKAKDVISYKLLLDVFGSYSKSFPCTGVDALFDTLVEKGKKVLPKDKKALEIIQYLCTDNASSAVQKILNMRFDDLCAEVKPLIKTGSTYGVAYWERDNKVNDRIKSLIDWEVTGKLGKWSDADGKKATLVDNSN